MTAPPLKTFNPVVTKDTPNIVGDKLPSNLINDVAITRNGNGSASNIWIGALPSNDGVYIYNPKEQNPISNWGGSSNYIAGYGKRITLNSSNVNGTRLPDNRTRFIVADHATKTFYVSFSSQSSYKDYLWKYNYVTNTGSLLRLRVIFGLVGNMNTGGINDMKYDPVRRYITLATNTGAYFVSVQGQGGGLMNGSNGIASNKITKSRADFLNGQFGDVYSAVDQQLRPSMNPQLSNAVWITYYDDQIYDWVSEPVGGNVSHPDGTINRNDKDKIVYDIENTPSNDDVYLAHPAGLINQRWWRNIKPTSTEVSGDKLPSDGVPYSLSNNGQSTLFVGMSGGALWSYRRTGTYRTGVGKKIKVKGNSTLDAFEALNTTQKRLDWYNIPASSIGYNYVWNEQNSFYNNNITEEIGLVGATSKGIISPLFQYHGGGVITGGGPSLI
jgi:hypothetical protein